MRHIMHRAALVAAAITFLTPAAAHAQRDRNDRGDRLDTTFAFARGGSVDLRLSSGDIIVTGWTRPEVKINARVERGIIEASINSGRVSLSVRNSRGGTGEARYEVMVPIGTTVQTTSTSGDTRVKATAGEVQVNSTSGDIEVIDAGNRVTAETVSGSVHGSKLRGVVRMSTTSGDLEFDDVVGDLTTHTVSGEIVMRHMQLARLSTETTSGDITYSGSIDPKGNYELNAHSGDVTLDIPSSSSAKLDIQTFNGEITSRFPVTLQPGDRAMSKHNKKMQFTIGGGGARISIETFSGDINITRGPSSSKDN